MIPCDAWALVLSCIPIFTHHHAAVAPLCTFTLPRSSLPPAAVDEVAVSNCRQWLRQLQSFVMALQRDVDAFTLEAVRIRRCTATVSSPAATTTAAAAGKCSDDKDFVVMGVAAATPWREFLSKVSSQFDEAVEELEGIQQQVSFQRW